METDIRRGAVWFGALALVVLGVHAFLLLDPATVAGLVYEDGWFENIGAIGLGVAGVFFGLACWRSRKAGEPRLKQLALLVLAAVFVFGAGEEISWGQRIFGWEAVDETVNRQAETTVHNLRILYDDAPIRPYRLFTLPFFTFVFALPLVCWVYEPARRFFGRLIPLVPWTLGAVFLFNDLFSKVPEALIQSDVLQLHDNDRVEVRETAFAVLCAATAFYVFRYLPQRGRLVAAEVEPQLTWLDVESTQGADQAERERVPAGHR